MRSQRAVSVATMQATDKIQRPCPARDRNRVDIADARPTPLPALVELDFDLQFICMDVGMDISTLRYLTLMIISELRLHHNKTPKQTRSLKVVIATERSFLVKYYATSRYALSRVFIVHPL